MTIKEYQDALRASHQSAREVIGEILQKYATDQWGRAYIRVPHHGNFWNCYIEGIGKATCKDKGKIYLDIYWQGDSTDGNCSILLDELLEKKEVILPATEKHSRLRIEREWLTDVFEGVAYYLNEKS